VNALLPRPRRTPLGDVVTTMKDETGEHITLECPIDVKDGHELEPYSRAMPRSDWKGEKR
jgi:hypothetical protein